MSTFLFPLRAVCIIFVLQGHFPWPDASQWTDKELGIPDDIPLDEELE